MACLDPSTGAAILQVVLADECDRLSLQVVPRALQQEIRHEFLLTRGLTRPQQRCWNEAIGR
jgi:hypothetical protein